MSRKKPQATIVLDHVTRGYGSVIGLNDVSLEIRPGVTGLLGPNGAGKSTLMKVVAGLMRPGLGAVEVLGEPPFGNADLMRRMGFCPEWDAFYRDMTGFEFVVFLTRMHGVERRRAEELATEALVAVELSDKMDEPIATYSKGMRQRTKLAQAIVHDPDVLLLDEPLSGTDPVGRKIVADLIRAKAEAGKTVLVSSHILHEIEVMTRSIVMIHRGKVLAEGEIQGIRDMIDQHPHHIVIECDEPRAFARHFAGFGDVTQITFAEEGFVIATTEPDECYDRIPRLALEQGVKLRALTCSDNDLGAVFRYLIG
jgi:ABC-2 type transport system ATP-binding protein